MVRPSIVLGLILGALLIFSLATSNIGAAVAAAFGLGTSVQVITLYFLGLIKEDEDDSV